VWLDFGGALHFTPQVRSQILKAAGKGVRFRMIINKYSPSLDEFWALFEPIRNAELAEGEDNAISLQGLSDREVVIAFPGMDGFLHGRPGPGSILCTGCEGLV
jgi:hypothetical protein